MRLHPFTAVRDAAAYATRIGSLGIFAGFAATSAGLLPGTVAFGIVAVSVLAGAAYGVARYFAFAYELDGATLVITSGVARRRSREIPLERVQNVDVEQSFLQRLLGLAAVRFETAGGGATEGELRLVSVERADTLQAELRRRKREVDAEHAGEQAPAGEPQAELLYELSPRGLALLAAVSFRPGAIPLVLFSTPFADDLIRRYVRTFVVPVLLGGRISLADPRLLAVGVGGLLAVLIAAWIVSAAITVTRYHRFRLVRLDDELRYERGLLRRFSGTVPLAKVQALAVEENVAMRWLGYAALTIETAGYAPGGGDAGRSPSAVPLADRGTVRGLVGALEGVEHLGVERPPGRARRRYAGRYAIVALVLAAAFATAHAVVRPLGVLWAVPAAAFLAVVPAAHLTWVHRGHWAGEDHVRTRAGFWRRATRVVPYHRLQTVFTRRTVFQRRFALASVVADTAAAAGLRSRDATAHDLDRETAQQLHGTLLERFRESLAERRVARARDAARRTAARGRDSAAGDGSDVQPGDGRPAGGGASDGTGAAGEPSEKDGVGDAERS